MRPHQKNTLKHSPRGNLVTQKAILLGVHKSVDSQESLPCDGTHNARQRWSASRISSSLVRQSCLCAGHDARLTKGSSANFSAHGEGRLCGPFCRWGHPHMSLLYSVPASGVRPTSRISAGQARPVSQPCSFRIRVGGAARSGAVRCAARLRHLSHSPKFCRPW